MPVRGRVHDPTIGPRVDRGVTTCGFPSADPVATTLQPRMALQNVDGPSDHQSGERQ